MEEEEKKEKPDLTARLRSNPWILSTFVLVILAVVLLVGSMGGFSFTGNTISSSDAEGKFLQLVSSQLSNVQIIDIKKEGSLYNIMFTSTETGTSSVYITLDGKYVITGLIPLDTSSDSSADDSSTPSQIEVPKSDKPTVQLFVMSHCPYGVKAQEILLPVLKLLGTKATITVNFVSYAMHGKTEIDDNNIEYCLQKEQPSAFIKFLDCFVTSENSTQCLISSGANKNQIDSCIAGTNAKYKTIDLYNDQSTWLNGQYPQYPVEKDLNDKLGVQGSESLIINGIKVSPSDYRWDTNKLKEIICSAFNTPPSECSQTLSSSNDSAPASGSCG